MTETFVVHLQSQALADGDVRGLVEIVATGESRTVSTLEQLHELLVQNASHNETESR